MIILTGNGLNERHRELNSKVKEAAASGLLFDNIKLQEEKTDVDRLFKIDLANSYKNVDYIIENLKCGDSVYIKRAMKCTWLYGEEFSTFINPDYLHQNIFPEMSFKMKRTFLKIIAQYVTNNGRAEKFYQYCIGMQLNNIALKFLLYTSDEFKVKVMKEQIVFMTDEEKIKVIGDSFLVAATVLDQAQMYKIEKYLIDLCHLYSVSEKGYLDLVENIILKTNGKTWNGCRLGLRISKHIIKNHKERLFSHTSLYLNMLNKKMTAKYSTPDDVKNYIGNTIPSKSSDFWHFYKSLVYIFDVIPLEERFSYIKEIFNKSYPDQMFEMSIHFYYADLHKIMTPAERESWALKHIEEGMEHFGQGQDYRWYEYVSFEKAYPGIKKCILIASNADIRTSAIKVLVHSAQGDRDFETLFNYYYQRFVNEMNNNKEKFVDEVLEVANTFKFDEDCWNAFNKILHSMDVYDNLNAYSCKIEYRLVAIIQTIIRRQEMHEALKTHINDGINLYQFKILTDKLTEEKVQIVYDYMMNYYLEKINSFDITKYNDKVKRGVKNYIHNLLELMSEYDKSINDIPEIVTKFISLDKEEYQYNSMFRIEEKPFNQLALIKDLKKDASSVVSKIPLVQRELKMSNLFNLSVLLRKIKMYFSNDVALKYLEMYKKLLASGELSANTTDHVVYGILNIANYEDSVEFISNFVPTEAKIDHVNIERKLLYTRTAICKFMFVSRPVLPLSIVQKYITGDYLKLCLPIFQSYAANLPPAQLAEFVKFLIKSPASIQKHGLRMAFQCFTIKDLKTMVLDVWKKTKNVSLRLVVYKAVHDKIVSENNEYSQSELFEAFDTFTLNVREDDDEEFFQYLTGSNLPSHVLGRHIASAWQGLKSLPNKKSMIERQSTVIKNMTKHINLMQQDVIEPIIREHVKKMLIEEEIKVSDREYDVSNLIHVKWELTAKYLMQLPNKEVLEQKSQVLETLLTECVRLWNYTDDNVYAVRKFFMDFISNLARSVEFSQANYCLNSIVLQNQVLKHLRGALPIAEIYNLLWDLRISNIYAYSIAEGKRLALGKSNEDEEIIFTECVKKLSQEFTNLVNEFIESNIYFTCMMCKIKKYLLDWSSTFTCHWPSKSKFRRDYIIFEICCELIKVEKTETYKLAAQLWPVTYKTNTACVDFVNKMNSADNEEIKYLLYQNLVVENCYNTTPY